MPPCSCSNATSPAPWRTVYGVSLPAPAPGVAHHSSPVSLVAQVQHLAHRIADRIVVPRREAEEVAVLGPGEAAAPLGHDEAAVRIGDDVGPRRRRHAVAAHAHLVVAVRRRARRSRCRTGADPRRRAGSAALRCPGAVRGPSSGRSSVGSVAPMRSTARITRESLRAGAEPSARIRAPPRRLLGAMAAASTRPSARPSQGMCTRAVARSMSSSSASSRSLPPDEHAAGPVERSPRSPDGVHRRGDPVAPAPAGSSTDAR